MTVKEFKLWLEGVMAFQGGEWKPNSKQWSVILQKINEIEEVEAPQHLQDDTRRSNELVHQQPIQPIGRPVSLHTSGLFATDNDIIEEPNGYKSPF